MKKIYIILTHTGTFLSTIIKYYTKDEFSHISIALDDELKEMYSFGRLHPCNPFWGGFVHEEIDKGTFKRFKNTRAEIYSLFVTDEQYERINKNIEYFKENKQKYKFNIVGLLCVSIHKKVKSKNTFYCAEFVKHILKSSGVSEVKELPEIIKPEDFEQLKGLRFEYNGLLKKYKKKKYLEIDGVHNLMQNKKISYV